MNRFLPFVIAALCWSVAGAALAQITFDRQYFEGLVGTYSETSFWINLTTDPTSALAVQGIIDNANGPNQTYDFSALPFAAGGTADFEFTTNVASFPGASRPEFASANVGSISHFSEETQSGTIEGTGYFFGQLNDGALLQLGTWVVTADSSFALSYSPPDSVYELPLTFGTAWTSTTTLMVGGIGLPESNSAVVEGYGTLMLPGGRMAQALRIKRISESGFGFSNITYDFETLEGHWATIDVSVMSFPPLPPVETLEWAEYGTSQKTTAIDDEGGLPESFVLHQNYPNPFNPETAIPFELSAPGHASMRVYDTLGRDVATLVDATLPAGSHRVMWTPDGLPSGIYYYTLDVNGESRTKSLLLMK